MKGQLSAEMLILIAVVLAVVAIAAMQMIGSAKQTSSNIGTQTDKLNKDTVEAIKSPPGGYCFNPEDCQAGGSCVNNRCA
ncbi:class III signal peptide-containing protein [Candidatus Micrarchaeota archaeon]|nr:class III signal peptide-containing protein [Candidatus Micrarchaeota archaeon]